MHVLEMQCDAEDRVPGNFFDSVGMFLKCRGDVGDRVLGN
jgi:hypothetical protein